MKHFIQILLVGLLGAVAIAGPGCSCDPPPDGDGDGDGDDDDAGPDPCVPGTVDCACDDGGGGACGDDLVCEDDVCVACVFGTVGCPCDAGACGDDVCDADTGVCRAPSECEQAGCAQRQLCTQEPGADAVCLPACEAGFEFDPADGGSCLALPSCDAVDPGYCGDDRACAEGGVGGGQAGDVCGDCDTGFIDVDGACVDNSCAGLDCEGRLNRFCTEGANGPACVDCQEGFVDDVAAPGGVCTALVTCESLNCQAPLECVFDSGNAVPQCREPSLCPDQQVQNSSGTCVACTACFQNGVAKDGVVGVGNGGIAFGSSCICALEDNAFQGVDGVVRSCDADGDGWVNSRLLTSLNLDGNPNNPLAANARCHVRVIDRVELRGDDFRPEFGGIATYAVDAQRTVPISALNLGIQTAKLYEPEETDDPTAFGLRYKLQGTPPEKLLRTYGLTAPVNDFADVVAGHLRAAEVNPLTKACNHDNDDLNLDGIADVAQIHGAFPAGTLGFGPDAAPAADVFYKFAYFLELAHSSFRDRTGAGVGNCNGAVPCFGALVIQEKLRAPDVAVDPESLRLELTYADGENAQWRTCQRGRDSSYPGAASNTAQNSDFAEWSEGCETTSGSCLVGSGSARHVAYDGRPPGANRTLEGVRADADENGEARFVGMNHASQFKCVSFDAAQNNVTPARRKPPEGAVFNDCRLDPRRSDPALTPEPNPADPFLACTTTTAEPTGSAAASRNFWVALQHDEYASPGGYTVGCISEGAEWGDLLCVVERNSTPDDRFGALFCGCGDSRAGLDCELSCPPPHVLSSRIANVDTGEVEGFFSCFVPAGSDGAVLSGGGFTLTGAVPAFSSTTTEASGGPFTLKPAAFP